MKEKSCCWIFSPIPCQAAGLGSLLQCTQWSLMKNRLIYVHCSSMLITQRCLFRLCLLIVGALKFYARSRTILWCCKRALHCYAPWGTLALACLLIKWFWHRVALLCGSTNQISVKRFLLAVLVFWPRCCKNASFVCVGTLELAAVNC